MDKTIAQIDDMTTAKKTELMGGKWMLGTQWLGRWQLQTTAGWIDTESAQVVVRKNIFYLSRDKQNLDSYTCEVMTRFDGKTWITMNMFGSEIFVKPVQGYQI